MPTWDCPIAQAAAQYPREVALAHGPIRWSFQQWDDAIQQQADRLRRVGLVGGQRVAWRATSDAHALTLLWALLRNGNIACPVSPRFPPRAADAIADAVGAVAWWDPRQDPKPESGGIRSSRSFSPGREEGEAPSTILFSSGTTSLPRAIVHNRSAHEASALGANQNLPLSPGDRWLLSLPWSHVSGLGILFRCAMAAATVVVPTPKAPILEELTQLSITHVSLVSTQLKRLLAQRVPCPASLRGCLVGGGALPPSLVLRARDAGWPVLTTYGLTEMASQVTTSDPKADSAQLRTAGRVLPGRELKIARDGEILVRGATLFRGYLTAGRVQLPLDESGWFPTGDHGRLEDNGCLVVLGRRDQMFISGGENIHPEEIEQALQVLEDVMQAVVVPLPDPEFGQQPVAIVQSQEFRPDAWRETLSDQLPRFKIPKRFLSWPDSLPPSGLKPSRTQLQAFAQQQLAQVTQPTSPRSSTEP